MQNMQFVMRSTVEHIGAIGMYSRDTRQHVVSNLEDFDDFKKILPKRHPRRRLSPQCCALKIFRCFKFCMLLDMRIICNLTEAI